MSLNSPAFLALKGRPDIAQGETLGLEFKREITPEGDLCESHHADGPEGTTEISRWRKPPECAAESDEPRMGRLKIHEVNRVFQSPLSGLGHLLGPYRWLTPPANIHRPSGPWPATFAEVSEGASYEPAKKLGTPLQGSPSLMPGTQGFTLGYVRSPLWGCLGSHV